MKKNILFIKFCFCFFCFFACNKVIYAFPEELTSINIVPANTHNDGTGQSNSICVYSKDNITRQSTNCKGTMWKSNYKKASASDGNTYMAICTNQSATSPAGKGVSCTRDTSMSDANKAGIASILKNAGSFGLTSNGKCVTDGEGSDGCKNQNFVKATITITKFLNRLLLEGDCSIGNICESSWLEAATTARTNVQNAIDAKNNKTFVSIGNVTHTEDDTAFYLTIPVTSSYNFQITSVTHGELLADGRYKILKSSLSEGENSITIEASASYSFDIAENYVCDKYQSITINKIETKKIEDTTRKPIKLSKTSKGTIKLKKVNTAGTEIIGKDVGIELYNGHGCDQANINDSIKTFQSGREISLDAGNYSIKEITPPTGYDTDNACHNFIMQAGKKSEDLVITNVSTCVSDVMDLIDNNQANDRSERIRIYKKYNTNINSINNLKFTNLLNFNLEYVTGADKEAFANSVCSKANCSNNDLDFHCLYAKTTLSNFDENNLACYTSTIDQNNNTGFCQTTFLFQGGSSGMPVEAGGYYFLNTHPVKNGQFVFKSDYIGTAELEQKCYFATNLNVDKIDAGVYDDYVQRVGFDMKEVSKEENQNEDLILKRIGTNAFRGDLSINYIMDEVYVERISGKRCSQEQIEADKSSVVKKCRNLGRGLISNFEDGNFSKAHEFSINNDGGTYIPIQFSVSLNSSIFVNNNNNVWWGKGTCVYPIKPEVITYDDKPNGELKIEFRTIDTNNPFNRNTRSNWGDGTNKSKNNKTVKEYITNSDVNNSYNRTGEGSLYTNQTDGTKRIILTPQLVQQIREYNKSNPYDDYTVYTEEDESGKTKTSTSFFDYIGLTKVQ